MAILGTLLKRGIKLRENREQEYSTPFELQKSMLKELLITASKTEFGRYYNFKDILKKFRKGPKEFYKHFCTIPIHDYNKMHKDWWQLSLKGAKNICWPGRIKYFALSSGTSESASKYIPVTKDMTKAIQKTSLRQILSLSRYDLPSKFFEAGILMVGGSTHLNKRGSFYEGDLSGIQAARLPFWFQHFYKPGKSIAKTRKWDLKLDKITKKAADWNIGIIVGVPAWIQILLEKIIAHNKVKHIHEIWPNLNVYVHGGVAMDPYRKGFEKLLGKPIHYIETYLASEGFLAYQAAPNHRSMKLVLNNGLFYEFIPFNQENFLANGEVRPEAKTLLIDEVEEGKEYAILLSTCAGTWRYLIGDVIRVTSIEEMEIVITGRTKHFLSLCGEHLSVDNMNKAIELVANELNIDIKEFTVAGIPHGSLFAHHWFVGTDNKVDKKQLKERLDHFLKTLNDDYTVERAAALKDVFVDVVPVSTFYSWMESKGKSGGQNKFPRVAEKCTAGGMEILYYPVILVIFKGIELGLVLAFLVGPVFFTIIQTSIERGFLRGAMVVTGVSISDLLYVAICYLGLAQVMADSDLKVYMAYGGGVILIGFGLYHSLIKSRRPANRNQSPIKERKIFRYIIKGFVINGMTPMVLFFWIGAVSVATIDFGYTERTEFIIFFGSVLVTVLLTDMAKAYLADKFRRIITDRTMMIMNISLGILLIFFGCRLIYLAQADAFI